MGRLRAKKSKPGCTRRHEHGAAMVEFALVFLLLFTLVTLVAQGGLFFSGWLAVTNGAREGARFSAPCLDRNVQPCYRYPPGYPDPSNGNPNVYDEVYYFTRGFLDQSPGRFTVIVASTSAEVTVTVTAKVSSVGAIPLDLPVYGVSTMRLEMSPQ